MSGQTPHSQQEAFEARERYVRAFNDTMVKIWKEKIQLLQVIDTGRLYNSVVEVALNADAKFTEVTFKQEFQEYGIYQERGTGKNTPKGNPGDLGRPNRRVKKQWLTRKHLASKFNIQEFMADNLGQEICLAVSNIFDKNPTVTKGEF